MTDDKCVCGHAARQHAGPGWCATPHCPCNGGIPRAPEPGATYSEEGRRSRDAATVASL